MSKIIINSNVFSKNEEERLTSVLAILKDGTINYKNNGVNVIITLLKDKIILVRENDNMKLTLEFEKNKNLITKYVIKDLGVEIKVETKTNRLIINNNNFEIEYELFMNDEFSDTFNYKVEWSELKWI